jgi:asparagine synthase (glutamine-hydrolysing)
MVAMSLRGADPSTVEHALDSETALAGTAGFAGEIDGLLVRDVLGRYPLFIDSDKPDAWSHDPTQLTDPERVPAGCVHNEGELLTKWTLPTMATREQRRNAVLDLRDALSRTLSTIDQSGLAVAFSGGVDSALLASQFDVPLYTVGFPQSHDLVAAHSAAELLDAELRVVELDHAMLERAVPEVAEATGRQNAMDVQIAVGVFLLAQQVHEDGFDRIALGQGADELFGGYAKVARAPEDPRVEADTIRGARRELVGTLPTQLERDWLTITAAGLEPVTPLLHDRVVRSALELSGDHLVTESGERKWAFRLAAREWLPDQLAFREKKALQYGSLVARELDRLARQAGFKRRMDDHVTQYVESLL